MDIIDQILSLDNIEKAYNNTQKSKGKYKQQAIDFSRNETANLRKLVEELQSQKYLPSEHNKFFVFEPKLRLIYSPAYRDKIVHHAINNILRDIVEPTFIFDSYACIRNKGNQRAVRRLLQFTRKASTIYDTPYVIKIDIQKFFYTIDHDVMCDIIDKELDDEWMRWILKLYVRRSPTEKGLPLGNLLSQILVNIMMNLFDQWCKRSLKIKFYLRYSDDIIAIVDGRDNARAKLLEMKSFLEDVLLLKVHPKKTLSHPLSQNLKAFGFSINPRGIFMTQDTRRRIQKKLLITESEDVASSLIEWVQVSSSRRDIHRLVFSTNRWNIVYKGNRFKRLKFLNKNMN